MTYWGGSDDPGEPVDPNPATPAAPPGWSAPPGPGPYPPYGYAAPPGASASPSYGYAAPPSRPGYGAPLDPRPATATTAAVLAFVLGGLVLLEGVLLLVGASVVGSIEQALDQSPNVPASLIVNGVLNLVVGSGLIAGGVLLLQRRLSGRLLLAAANVVAAGQSIYWTAVSDAGAVAVTLLHAALAMVGLALAFTVSAATWLRTGSPSG